MFTSTRFKQASTGLARVYAEAELCVAELVRYHRKDIAVKLSADYWRSPNPGMRAQPAKSNLRSRKELLRARALVAVFRVNSFSADVTWTPLTCWGKVELLVADRKHACQLE